MIEYQLPDEPRPSRWTAVAVNPLWPLLAFMFGGFWAACPWFLVNGVAIGSPDRRRQLGLVVLAAVGAVAITLGLFVFAEHWGKLAIRFALLGLTLWKLAFAYFLYARQSHVFALYEYYGGTARNGAFVVLAAFVLAAKLQATLPTFWRIVLQ